MGEQRWLKLRVVMAERLVQFKQLVRVCKLFEPPIILNSQRFNRVLTGKGIFTRVEREAVYKGLNVLGIPKGLLNQIVELQNPADNYQRIMEKMKKRRWGSFNDFEALHYTEWTK
jgi:hypothetical protein